MCSLSDLSCFVEIDCSYSGRGYKEIVEHVNVHVVAFMDCSCIICEINSTFVSAINQPFGPNLLTMMSMPAVETTQSRLGGNGQQQGGRKRGGGRRRRKWKEKSE